VRSCPAHHLKSDIGFANPISRNRKRRVFRGYLLYAHDNVHGTVLFVAVERWPELLGENWLLAGPAFENHAALVPPNPKEFDSAYSTEALRALLEHSPGRKPGPAFPD